MAQYEDKIPSDFFGRWKVDYSRDADYAKNYQRPCGYPEEFLMKEPSLEQFFELQDNKDGSYTVTFSIKGLPTTPNTFRLGEPFVVHEPDMSHDMIGIVKVKGGHILVASVDMQGRGVLIEREMAKGEIVTTVHTMVGKGKRYMTKV